MITQGYVTNMTETSEGLISEITLSSTRRSLIVIDGLGITNTADDLIRSMVEAEFNGVNYHLKSIKIIGGKLT